MLDRIRRHAETIVVAMVTAAVTAAVPAVAGTIADYARNADKVDGKHAVGSGASVDARKGKLVATNPLTGRLPNGIIATAPNAELLDGQDSSAFLGASGKAADSDLLDGQDSSAFLGATGKAADSELLDGVDSSGFYAAGSKVADSNTLDGVDSLGFAGSQIYVREMLTDGSANAQGTCPEGDLCFAGGYYCDTGDTLLGGGFAEIDNGTRLVASEPFVPNPQDAWRVKFVNNATEDTITVYTICADNGTTHGGH